MRRECHRIAPGDLTRQRPHAGTRGRRKGGRRRH